MLDESIDFLQKENKKDTKFTWEILVVSDGSHDNTKLVVYDYCKKYGSDKVRVIEYPENRGKGHAVKIGMLHSRGKFLLLCDADGATKFSDFINLKNKMKTDNYNRGVVYGSRAHLENDAIAQCGFKLFTRESAQLIFPPLHIERWTFDVEILLISRYLEIPVEECSVNWCEIDGSKLSVISASVDMLREMICLKLLYLFHIWTPHDI